MMGDLRWDIPPFICCGEGEAVVELREDLGSGQVDHKKQSCQN